MKFLRLLLLIIVFLNICRSWEYCQTDIQNKLCAAQKHFICDSKNAITNTSYKSKIFLAHVPLTRKVKQAFINWHNYYRNRTAGGWVKNIKNNLYFPKAIRMRELIWDNELSFLSHSYTKLVNSGEVKCRVSQRFPYVGQNLKVKAMHDSEPVLKVIALSLKEMFDEKNYIKKPNEMPKQFLNNHTNAKQFTIMVNDRVSRLGCAVALGADCMDHKGIVYKFCYYTACAYDFDNHELIYKIGEPTRRCSRWGAGKSKTYIYLCANSG